MQRGSLDDWHPPVMARLWGLFDAVGWHGTAPLFVLQTVLFFGGLGLVVAALPRLSPVAASIAALALLIPADWLTAVVKDAQMVAALTAATGIVAWYRQRSRAVSAVAATGVAVLLAFALLVRANAVFAVAPLVAAWAGWGGVRHPLARALLMLAGVVAVLAVSPSINHHVLGARASHVERVLPLYDLAGIAHFGGTATLPRLPEPRWRATDAAGCYDPYLWDALGDARRCGFVAETVGLEGDAGAPLIGEWALGVVTHPFAYARHRFGHFNATMRWLVPFGQPNAAAPPDSQSNDLGIGRRADPVLVHFAAGIRAVAATPFGWPAVWLAASLGLWWTAAGTPRGPARDTALALAMSAALMLLSFAFVSIASDLRYHLWAMVAGVLGGLALAAADGVPRRRVRAAVVATGLVAAAGIVARLTLAPGAW